MVLISSDKSWLVLCFRISFLLVTILCEPISHSPFAFLFYTFQFPFPVVLFPVLSSVLPFCFLFLFHSNFRWERKVGGRQGLFSRTGTVSYFLSGTTIIQVLHSIEGTTTDWMEDYLKGRGMRTVVKDGKSEW